MRYACVSQPQSLRVALWPAKKRKTKARQTKATGARLEDFLDWTGVPDIEPVKEEEMFILVIGFATRKRKQSVTLEGANTSTSGERRPRRPPSDEET